MPKNVPVLDGTDVLVRFPWISAVIGEAVTFEGPTIVTFLAGTGDAFDIEDPGVGLGLVLYILGFEIELVLSVCAKATLI